MPHSFRFTAPLWEWTSRDNWFFVSLPADESADIADTPRPPSGFGSVRVRVTVGGSRWTTSIFPGSDDGRYALPIKRAVRVAEGIEPGGNVDVALELID